MGHGRDDLRQLRARRLPGVRRGAAVGFRRPAHPHPPASARGPPAGGPPRRRRRPNGVPPAMNPIRRRRLWFVLALVAAAAVATTLVAMALQRNVTYLYTPAEVLDGRAGEAVAPGQARLRRSEEHTSELQSRPH